MQKWVVTLYADFADSAISLPILVLLFTKSCGLQYTQMYWLFTVPNILNLMGF